MTFTPIRDRWAADERDAGFLVVDPMPSHKLVNGRCVTCRPITRSAEHVLVDGVCESCSAAEPMGEAEHVVQLERPPR